MAGISLLRKQFVIGGNEKKRAREWGWKDAEDAKVRESTPQCWLEPVWRHVVHRHTRVGREAVSVVALASFQPWQSPLGVNYQL